ncbi:hypothetical protein PROFUN_11266 [Planoprotostelium fungivorum]|uniref:Zn(2)-C6 fungal-type domain-containing protein n=1 Tax=Planoprotostelium fungivorum TaxID=1890364 RepID=A0A2P6NAG3_9EUKA|nr:hypothetical protein PROFUN_11266 [Planoprotostelium fungivorum]
MAGEGGPSKRGTRAACLSCKASHVCCDEARPCSRCIRLNRECIDPNLNQTKRSPKNPTPSPTDSLPPTPQVQTEYSDVSWINTGISEEHQTFNMALLGFTQPIEKRTAEDVVQLMSSRGWMTEREAALFIKTCISINEERKRNLDASQVQERLSNMERHIDESPLPTIVTNCFGQITHFNDSFIRTTGITAHPEDIISLDLFDYSPSTMRMLSWFALSPNRSLVIPAFLRVWTPGTDFKTVQRHGLSYIEGVQWIDRDMIGQMPACAKVYFMPSPASVS